MLNQLLMESDKSDIWVPLNEFAIHRSYFILLWRDFVETRTIPVTVDIMVTRTAERNFCVN